MVTMPLVYLIIVILASLIIGIMLGGRTSVS